MVAKLVILFVVLATVGQAVAQPITIGIMTANGNEGDTIMVCVSITSGSTAGRQIELDYSTTDGDAVNGQDYTSVSGTLTFDDASPTEQCISVMTIEDTTAESLECFRVVLNNDPNVLPADVTVDPSDAAVCIADDDGVAMPIVQPQLAAYTVNEADTPVIICVEALNIVAQTEVGFSTSDDTATAGQDYDTASGTFTFSPTATLLCVNVAIRDDAIAETQECFNFNLNTPAGVSNPQPNTPVCIVDDDSTQQFRVGFDPAVYVVPENVGPNVFQVCVSLLTGTLVASEFVRVELSLTQGVGTAELDLDFSQVSNNPQPVQFDASNQNQALCVLVTILDNLVFEPSETFYAVISESGSNVAPVTVDPSMARITILDNDDPPTTVPMETPTFDGPSVGDDPHFAIFLPSGKLLCYTVQGEHGFAFNLISNEKIHMNALFVPDSHREEVTWIGSLGIVVQNTHFQGSNTTRIRFESKLNEIHINDRVTLEAKNIEAITFRNGKLLISEGAMPEGFHYPSVRVNLDDLGMSFTVNFTGEHLDMMWNNLEENENSHGLIGQFFRKGVEIDVAKKLLLLPGKDPVPVMRKPVWAYMEHNVPSDQLCWVAMNPGYQGNHLIDGHYLDYVVDSVISTDFKFECKHKHQKRQ